MAFWESAKEQASEWIILRKRRTILLLNTVPFFIDKQVVVISWWKVIWLFMRDVQRWKWDMIPGVQGRLQISLQTPKIMVFSRPLRIRKLSGLFWGGLSLQNNPAVWQIPKISKNSYPLTLPQEKLIYENYMCDYERCSWVREIEESGE